MTTKPLIRHHSKYVPLTREQFRARFFERFYDPAFDAVRAELEKVCEIAWDGYIQYRKSPRTQAAGPGFADPAAQVPMEWLEASKAIRAAQVRHELGPSTQLDVSLSRLDRRLDIGPRTGSTELVALTRQPTLLLLADEERSGLTGEARARTIARLPAGSRTVVFDSGHTIHRERPEAYVATALEWLG